MYVCESVPCVCVCLCVFGEEVVCTHVCQCVRVYACVVLCVVYVSVRWGLCVRIHGCVRARVYVCVFSVCVCVCVRACTLEGEETLLRAQC